MVYCPDCQTLEGKTVEMIDEEGCEITACGECGSLDINLKVPEHDDCDLER